jgi:hypothetical protein
MHHLAAIQNEGLTIWDASSDITFISDIHLLFTTTDGPGRVYWDGMVGHSGRHGCRMYCGCLGDERLAVRNIIQHFSSHWTDALVVVIMQVSMSPKSHWVALTTTQKIYAGL